MSIFLLFFQFAKNIIPYLIDNLVVKVFVDDGYATAHIKLGNATEVADIRLKEVKKALEHIFNCVQTLSPLAPNE